MYKKVTVIAFGIFMLFFAAQLVTALWTSRNSDGFQMYNRFWRQDSDSSSVRLNWAGFASWFQQEKQTIVCDTLQVSGRVIWPYGAKFQPVLPEGSPETQVAETIASRIEATVRAAEITYNYDYDGTSAAVRRAARADTVSTQFLPFDVHLYSTASPEARKYGFQNSIAGGHEEYENMGLAQQRGDTSAVLLLPELQGRGLRCESVVVDSFDELQFGEREATLLAQNVPLDSILASMRYVEYHASIPVQRVQIETRTLPIALPFWLGLLVLGLMFGWQKRRDISLRKPAIIAVVVAAIWGLGQLIPFIPAKVWWFLYILLQIIRLALAIYMFVQFVDWGRPKGVRPIDWKLFWAWIATKFGNLLGSILGRLDRVGEWFAEKWIVLIKWWQAKTPQQRTIILLATALSLSVAGNIAQFIYRMCLDC